MKCRPTKWLSKAQPGEEQGEGSHGEHANRRQVTGRVVAEAGAGTAQPGGKEFR